MNDLIGNPLIVGEFVVLRMPQYSRIVVGRVFKLAPQKVRVEYINDWNFLHGYRQQILVEPQSLCVIHGPLREKTIQQFLRDYAIAN